MKYHPFDPEVRDKYVVGDDYLPTWKVPSLAKYYKDLGFGMKRSFDAWLKSQDKVGGVYLSVRPCRVIVVLFKRQVACAVLLCCWNFG